MTALNDVIPFLQQMSNNFDKYSEQFSSIEQAKMFKHIWSFSAAFSILKHFAVQQFLSTAPGQLTRETSKSYSLLGDILYYARSRVSFDQIFIIKKHHY